MTYRLSCSAAFLVDGGITVHLPLKVRVVVRFIVFIPVELPLFKNSLPR